MARKYNVVGIGGTFDHFHDGHKKFISFAAELGKHVHVGVTHPHLTLHKPYSYLIEPPEKRVRNVKKYCAHEHISCHTVELKDVFGPTLQEGPIEALVVTEETTEGAKKINETRLKMRLPELPVHVMPLLKNEVGEPLHSEHIRAGLGNRTGDVYPHLFAQDLVLTTEQRQFFKQPLGELVSQPTLETQSPICVVGDASLEQFISSGWNWYDVGIFDGLQQRQSFSSPTLDTLDARTITNQAGTISSALVDMLMSVVHDEEPTRTHIKINGEEDLATVALVLLLPLDSLVYYGQPNEGLVEVVVTEQLKEKVFGVLNPIPKLSQNMDR